MSPCENESIPVFFSALSGSKCLWIKTWARLLEVPEAPLPLQVLQVVKHQEVGRDTDTIIRELMLMDSSIVSPTLGFKDLCSVRLLLGLNLVVSISRSVCIRHCLHRVLIRCGQLYLPQAFGNFPPAHLQLWVGCMLFKPTFREPLLAGGIHLSLFPTPRFSQWLLSLRSTVCVMPALGADMFPSVRSWSWT